MSNEATTSGVYHRRIERVQSEMQRQGLDLLLVGPSSDLLYLTGYDAHLSERLNLLGVPASGKPFLIVPLLESPLASGARDLVDMHIWSDTESPLELAASVVGNIAGKAIGVSDQLWSGFLLKLQAVAPGASWVSGQDVMRSLRVVKDQDEIATMTEVSRLTDESWHEFLEGGPISGLSEKAAIDRLLDSLKKRGLTPAFGICASGPHGASPHHHTGERIIQDGDAVIFDWGGTLDGYHSDVTRTVFVGEPTAEFRQVYEIVKRANQASFEAVKPGVACEEIDRVARTIISSEGYGEQFLHRTGHGLGLDVHEEPYLVGGNSTQLAPGMVFSDEPGIYLAGKFGVRIEDTVVCTESGGNRLNEATRELTVMD